MRNIIRILVVSLSCFLFFQFGYSRERQFGNFKGTENIKSTAAGCSQPSGFRFLEINNVRARINTGGDMWWDLPGGLGGQYYVPANGSATSLFSGSLWIGGLDINNQLKLAALRYRMGPTNSGGATDYWTGPLTLDGTAAVDEATCTEYDKFFVVTREDVDRYVQHTDPETGAFISSSDYQIPESFFTYPAHGDVSRGQSFYLAPFKDADNNGIYDPTKGDYPYYDLENKLCPLNYVGDPFYEPASTMESEYYPNYYGGILVDQVLKGDETFWWVFNDKGNVHTETEGAAIGMEIRAQAFGFSTNDEINSMTFYSYEIINRSTYELTQTYFSPWVDTDLGYAWDDYIGCDVQRGLGYCYNGLPVDEGGPEAYGDQPPAIGVDFFQGPYMDEDNCDNPSFDGDGLLGPSYNGDCSIVTQHGTSQPFNYGVGDTASGSFIVRAEAINGINFGNGIEDDERFGMRRFVYHNNTGPSYSTDPDYAPDYYNFLRGIWKDNTRMIYGGNAHSTAGGVGPECDFMFPGDSDPCNWGTQGTSPNGGFNTAGYYWTEEVVGNAEGDRRFMQSAGPFTLKPGAVNYITVGIPWARATSGGPWASVELLRVVDDKCQALFENCFKVIDGPDAPDLTFQELDGEIIVYISNSPTSNNYKESYKELDPQIKAITPDSLLNTPLEYDPYFTFEGYQIFQLSQADVTVAESRYDLNKVRLVAQFDVTNGVGQIVNYKFDRSIGADVPVVEVEGGDNGIQHSFILNEDAFATGDRQLVNFKQYYYSVLAYGYNNYKEYNPTNGVYDGQKEPYLAGRKNIEEYTAIPHKNVNGSQINADYGKGPEITRIEGQGNGGHVLEFTDQTINELLLKPPAYLIEDVSIVKADDGTETAVTEMKYNYGQDDYPIAYKPVYKSGSGPVDIKVVDPLNVKEATYKIKFDNKFLWQTFNGVADAEEVLPGGDTAGVKYVNIWYLVNSETGNRYDSDVGTNTNYEQLFLDLGISVTFKPVYQPGLYEVGKKIEVGPDGVDTLGVNYVVAPNNGVLQSSVEYADSSRRWLGGVQDVDIPGSSINWIRSGTSFNQTSDDDYKTQDEAYDPEEDYERLIDGGIAPYFMCSEKSQDPYEAGPVFSNISKSKSDGLKFLASIDLVLTPDKSKWTRSPILEMCPDQILAERNAEMFSLRKSASVDKEGNPSGWPAQIDPSDNSEDPNYIRPYGMGWFPGYAVNLETGERLNIMFGEDSNLGADSARDMKFNPSDRYFSYPAGATVFGGKHYIYIMGSKQLDEYHIGSGTNIRYNFPAYDAGSALAYGLDTIPEVLRDYIFTSVMYVAMPLSIQDQEWLSNDVKISVRIAKPLERYYADSLDIMGSENNHYPMYEFSTYGMATTEFSYAQAKSDLDLIAVVPNPYYAWAVGSGYEEVPLDNLVKVINLPEKCVVSIYTLSGTLIRKLTKDDPVTFLNWDLKNQAGVPIAGGVYVIHVKDQTTNEEKIVKWFGSLRIEDFKEF